MDDDELRMQVLKYAVQISTSPGDTAEDIVKNAETFYNFVNPH